MFIEVESNPNCESSLFLRFKEVGPAKPVSHLKIYDRVPVGEWCAVTGWCDNESQPTCQAYAQLIEDSGAGYAYLVYGGIWGIRLQPESLKEPWAVNSSSQWGEPYLTLADERDLRYQKL